MTGASLSRFFRCGAVGFVTGQLIIHGVLESLAQLRHGVCFVDDPTAESLHLAAQTVGRGIHFDGAGIAFVAKNGGRTFRLGFDSGGGRSVGCAGVLTCVSGRQASLRDDGLILWI